MLGKRVHFDNLYLNEPQQYGGILLYQIGDLNCKGEYKVEQHVQYCHEITYIVSGIGSFEKDGKFFRVKSGDIFLSPKDSTHTVISSEENPVRYYYVGFSFDRSHPNYEKYINLDNFFETIKNPLVRGDIRIYNLFSMMFNEIVMDYENHSAIMEDCMELLLFLVERSYAPKKLAHKTEGIGEKKNNIVYEIINYIDNNIFAIQRLTDISQYTGYSYAYLSQVFSNAMGISLNVYYQNARFKRAVELLECGVGTTQVAELLGFDSVYSFSRAFKNHFGLSPTHYLKTISKNEPLSKNQK